MKTSVRSLSLTAFALALLALGMNYSAPGAQSAGKVEVKLLDQGDGRPKTVKAAGLINAPLAKVWKVLTHYNEYHKFMPRVSSSKLESRSGNLAQATYQLDAPWPLNGTWYTNRYVETPANHAIRWSMVKGSIKHNEGSWQLRAQGNATYATYTVIADLGIPAIPKWIFGEVTKTTVPSIFEAVEKQAAQL
jgi:ribosome-associated toxin RatA of RatAB toxin-antitoxin module